MQLPKYIIATKQIPYAVEHILDDMSSDPDFDISSVTPAQLLEYIEQDILDDFGYNQPTPTFTYEYEGDSINA